MGLRVIVCGGRDYTDYRTVSRVLNAIDRKYGIEAVIHGTAHGADKLAQRWGFEHHKLVIGCPARWEKHGKKAGPLRNQHMLDTWKPDACVAFPGGKGTADMIRRARAAGLKMKVLG